MSPLGLGNGYNHVKLDVVGVDGCLVHVGTIDLATKGLDDDTSDLVRVGTRGWSAVLEVTLALLGDGAVDTNT